MTCAMESPDVDFEEVEVQEWVCKKDLAESEKPADAIDQKTDTDVSTESIAVNAQSDADNQPVSDIAEKEYTLVKIVHTKLFCPLHNTVSLTVFGLRHVD